MLRMMGLWALVATASGCEAPEVLAPLRLGAQPAIAAPSGAAVPAPLRRLTRQQHHRSVLALFPTHGLTDTPGLRFPADETAGPFLTNVRQPVAPLQVDLYAAAAADLAARVTAAPADVERLVAGCNRFRGDEFCGTTALHRLARRAWRRPLDEAEQAALTSLYQQGAAGGGGLRGGLALGIEALLSSPSFLYLVEPGEPTSGGRLELTGFALASRLSFFLWNEGPDDALLDAAERGELDTAEGLAAQAWRLLKDERAAPQLGRFHLEWLGLGGLDTLEKDTRRYPFFTQETRDALKAETLDFVDTVLRRSDGRLETLLSAPFTLAREPALRVYGVDPPMRFTPGLPVGLDPAQRAGLLTQPAWLAAQANPATTSPVHRGLFVVTNLLCIPLGSPPPGVDVTPIGVDPTGQKTRRQLVERHTSDPACAGCHRLIDPIGLVFERYDAVGAWRTADLDDRQPIDTRVTITTGSDLDGPVDDPVTLVRKLARSQRVKDCAVRQWYRFALGRQETAEDEVELATLTARFRASDGHVPDLLVALVTSDAFRTRLP
ncbi:MAG: DUF1592 domain-containing protein [Myxococcaceae bacterium]|nr:DUF1592 domain-containing protein [Myxococcaceae bacterium]